MAKIEFIWNVFIKIAAEKVLICQIACGFEDIEPFFASIVYTARGWTLIPYV